MSTLEETVQKTRAGRSLREVLKAWIRRRRERVRTEEEGGTEPESRRSLVPVQNLCAVTDKGPVRPQNEDTFRVSANKRILVLADGMGGHAAGDVASDLAAQSLMEHLEGVLSDAEGRADGKIGTLLLEGFEAAHQRVREARQSRPEWGDMGTALIAALLQKNRLHTCHVGDVRCYLRTKDKFRQLTKDHTFVGSLVRAGAISAEEARTHPRKHEILQAVGLSDNLEPELNALDIHAGDRVLLCSDGLTDSLTDEQIKKVLDRGRSSEACAKKLVDLAVREGGTDNITVILYIHEAVPPEAGPG